MRQSNLFTKTRKETPADEVSRNAELLIRAGFVHKEMAGVYSLLPLGLRVMENITTIIREELNAVGGQEVRMTALQNPSTWQPTNRWSDDVVDNWFKTTLNGGGELGLAFTHEEPLTLIMRHFVSSYKDLPCYPYQFQTKFRNELRAKSGLLRGREFVMKDLYDFSRSQEEHQAFYEKMKTVYMNIFNRVGIGAVTYMTLSSGGTFSKYSYEFQTITDAGEDTILYDKEKNVAINKADYSKEMFADVGLNEADYSFEEATTVEVGDIYTLGEKYSRALGLSYADENGAECPVFMGSYGIGIQRLMGVVVEVCSDAKGIVWPESIAPFRVHLLSLSHEGSAFEECEKLYSDLVAKGITVLYDDRAGVTPGVKFSDADLIGIPYRIVVSEQSLSKGGVEIKKRNEDSVRIMSHTELLSTFE